MVEQEIIKIILAILISMMIGHERKSRNKTVGARTLSLVCVGSVVATITALKYFPIDSGRVLAGIITGIGFLGAGAIISDSGNVRGLTTAASIWAIAIIGTVIGVGDYTLAITASIFLFMILELDYFKRRREKEENSKQLLIV